MNIALGQINTSIADFVGNRRKIVEYTREAREGGADLVVFPELSLCGYPPLDLLTYPDFAAWNLDSITWLCEQLPGDTAVAVGYIEQNTSGRGKPYYNSIAVVYGHEVVHRQRKKLLPTYDVFDEDRYFEPGDDSSLFQFKEARIGFAICEDIWSAHVNDQRADSNLKYGINPVEELSGLGADIIIAPSASPFYSGKTTIRKAIVEQISRDNSCITVYLNAVGANDSLVFDGNSLVADNNGRIVCRAAAFAEDLLICDTRQLGQHKNADISDFEDTYRNLYQALKLGLQDYLRKTGFQTVNLGLSGGIDSALVAAIATAALGPECVHSYAMPSRFSSDHSLKDARQLAKNLAIGYEEISIEPMFSAATESLAKSFSGMPEDVTEENIQARIRGMLLMAWSNKKGSLLITTGNKSEIAVGYCTLYGDMCGSVALIGDLLKTEVFGLSRYINEQAGYDLIPENILTKPPSAELRFDQKDEDSLPPYEVLDGILTAHLVDCLPVEDIIARGYEPETVRHIIRQVERNEYKRRQAAIVIKVSKKAFGQGRRIPIARALYEVVTDR
ncbi:MAG: NAD+ synthase [Spirochaetota bacterium]